MGLCKSSIFSIFTFINANNLKFCTCSYSSCVYRKMRFKGSNGKVCKMMMSHFRTLLEIQQRKMMTQEVTRKTIDHGRQSFYNVARQLFIKRSWNICM